MILQRQLLAFSLHFIHLGATKYKEGTMFDWKGSHKPLLLGLLLLSITGCSSSLRTSSSEPKITSSVPEPSILQDKVAAIPSLDAHLTKLAFFSSSASDIAPLQNPTYKNRFEHAATTQFYPEVQLEYYLHCKQIYVTMTVHVDENKSTFWIVDYDSRIEPTWTSSSHSVGIGVFGPGNWRAGSYEADIYINGEKVAMGSFEVY